MVDFNKAIRAIHPNVVTINGDTEDTIQTLDLQGNEVTVDWTAVKNWIDPNQYKYDRQAEYLSIEEQLDMQYWDRVNGTSTWKEHIDAVKTAHPKPTE